MKKIALNFLIISLFSIVLLGCKQYSFRKDYTNFNALIHDSIQIAKTPFLKVHLKNGDVCIFTNNWKIDSVQNTISGNGVKYDFNRTKYFQGEDTISIEDIAIMETNSKFKTQSTARYTALTILTSLDLFLSMYCLTVPKACFGSCPTFYLENNDEFHNSDAEGFSNAINPQMEYADIDALYNYRPGKSDSIVTITMKNEALETHCINKIRLLAYPITANQNVYHTNNDEFYLCEKTFPLSSAKATEGDITDMLKYEDKIERFSLSNEKNLAHKEEIILEFDSLSNTDSLGLITTFRQTLMTTFCIYNAIAYMGDQVSDYITRINHESYSKNKVKNSVMRELGKIDIYLWNETTKNWEYQKSLYETGPIAINKQIIPLQHNSKTNTLKIKLILNQGLWRIDNIALTHILQKVNPLEIDAHKASQNNEINNTIREASIDSTNYIISLPGDQYKFDFNLPKSSTNYALFLYSKGYYLEWMRKDWLEEKNLYKLHQMVYNPKRYLKEEAKTYKQYEKQIEQDFWNSKVNSKTYSLYEN